MTVVQAAKKLGVSEQRVRLLLAQGRIRGTKVGWSWDIPPAALKPATVHERVAGRPRGPHGVIVKATERLAIRTYVFRDGSRHEEGLVDGTILCQGPGQTDWDRVSRHDHERLRH